MSHKHIYSSWNQKIFLLVASLILFEFVGGLYLYLDKSHNVFSQFSLLFHIFLGIFLIIPFDIYRFKHSFDVLGEVKARGKTVGIISFVIITISCVTGTYQTFVGFEKGSYWMSHVHTWTGFAGMMIVIVHIITARFKDRRESSRFEDGIYMKPSNTIVSKNMFITTSASCISFFFDYHVNVYIVQGH